MTLYFGIRLASQFSPHNGPEHHITATPLFLSFTGSPFSCRVFIWKAVHDLILANTVRDIWLNSFPQDTWGPFIRAFYLSLVQVPNHLILFPLLYYFYGLFKISTKVFFFPFELPFNLVWPLIFILWMTSLSLSLDSCILCFPLAVLFSSSVFKVLIEIESHLESYKNAPFQTEINGILQFFST